MKVKEMIGEFGFSGIKFMILKILSRGFKCNLAERKRRESIYNYVTNHVFSKVNKTSSQDYNKEQKYIFTLWWDGINSAPQLIQACVKTLKKINGYKLIVLDKDNYFKYVELPQNIMDKFNCGKISIQHFSDIIRVNLLSKYICIWADATIFVSNNIDYVDKYDIFTLKRKLTTEFVSNNLWSGFFMSNSENTIDCFSTAKKCLDLYWEKYDTLIDYFLIDFLYLYLYNNDIKFSSSIDSLPFSEDIYILSDSLPLEYSQETWDSILSKSDIHKLSWKKAKNIPSSGNILEFLCKV